MDSQQPREISELQTALEILEEAISNIEKMEESKGWFTVNKTIEENYTSDLMTLTKPETENQQRSYYSGRLAGLSVIKDLKIRLTEEVDNKKRQLEQAIRDYSSLSMN